MRLIAAGCLALAAASAEGADRRIGLGSFDRIRVEAPVAVRVTTGASPAATLSGDGYGVDIRQSGTTLVIARRTDRWQERPATGAAEATTIVLTTPMLAGATLVGGGTLAVDRMKAPRIDLSVSGSGSMTVAAVDTEQANVTLVGNGTLRVAAGRAGNMRIVGNGAGTIDATGVAAGEVTARLDGAGDIGANARYLATITNGGAGRVTVAGRPRCVIRASAGPIACGAAAAERQAAGETPSPD